MTPETLTALKASIAHHEENLKAETPDNVRLGIAECALCTIFFDEDNQEFDKQCDGCPVKDRTREVGCRLTPYDQLANCADDWTNNPDNADMRELFLTAERAEIEFLRSLLPEEAHESTH